MRGVKPGHISAAYHSPLPSLIDPYLVKNGATVQVNVTDY